ncbi:MAG: fibronectin type III domain-containing protein [Bacteroidota bacterium]
MAQATFKLPRNISDLLERVKEIIGKLIANAVVYVTPNPTTIVLNSLVANLEKSHQAALKGGTDKKFQMNLDKKALKDNMTGLLGYIQTTSGGDPDKINLVADVKKKPSPKGLLPAPGNVRSDYGKHDGEIIFRWDGVAGRSMYTMQFSDTPGDDSKWTDVGFTGKLSYTAKGLISGKQYSFRVATISTAGISGWSDPSIHKAN